MRRTDELIAENVTTPVYIKSLDKWVETLLEIYINCADGKIQTVDRAKLDIIRKDMEEEIIEARKKD